MRVSATRTFARTYVRTSRLSEMDACFDGDLCLSRWKSRRRSFSLFAELSVEILSTRIYIYKLRERERGRNDRFLGLQWISTVRCIYRRTVAQLLIAQLCFVVETIKFRTRARPRDRANCARWQKNILYRISERAGHNIIRYSNFGGPSSKTVPARLIDVSEIKLGLSNEWIVKIQIQL